MINSAQPSPDPADAVEVDARIVDVLAEYDETIARGGTPSGLLEQGLPPELWPEFQSLSDCLARFHAAVAQNEQPHMDLAHCVAGPGAGSEISASVDSLDGERIGRFELLRELGRGGYGVVFLARDPALARLVALKVPRPEALVTADLRHRFLREAQAAARLKHRHLLPVYEIGEDGAICYLVAQYCAGPSLAQWLRMQTRPAPQADAARLVAQLADGLASAHGEGVLHRDIKPANILLEPKVEPAGDGNQLPLSAYLPKLSDFGLAKILHTADPDTRSGAVLGTPAYMAPEQASGRASATEPAADIYSLGCILYELLTGRPPFVGQTDAETLQQVLADDPVPPARLCVGVGRDLEAICLSCLAKRPEDRYRTAGELADDLRRFLDNRPTKVRPVSSWQALLKWSVRNRGIALLGGAVAILLVAIAVGSGLAAYEMARLAERERKTASVARAEKANAEEATRRAERERDLKDLERRRAVEAERQARDEVENRREVSEFLTDLLETSDVMGMDAMGFRRPDDANRELTARDLLDRGSQRLRRELIEQPLVRAQLLGTIGGVYSHLGDVERAVPQLEEALQIQRAENARPLELAETLHKLIWTRHLQGRLDEAEAVGREALALRRAELGDDDLLVASTMFQIGWVIADKPHATNRHEAEKLFAQALEIRRKHLPWNHRDIAIALSALAAARLQQDDAAGAVPILIQAAVIFAQQPGGDRLGRALSAYQRAVIARKRRQYERAEVQYREAIKLIEEFFVGGHPVSALALGDLAGMFRESKQFDKAEGAIRDALTIARRFMPQGHPAMVVPLFELANALVGRGEFDEATRLFEEEVAICRRQFAPDSREIREATMHLIRCHTDRGNHAIAVAMARDWFADVQRRYASTDEISQIAGVDFAVILNEAGERAEAESILRVVLAQCSGSERPATRGRALKLLARLLIEGEPGRAEADAMLHESIALYSRIGGGGREAVADCEGMIGQLLSDRGDVAAAEPHLAAEYAILDRDLTPGHWRKADAGVRLGICLAQQQRWSEALPLLVDGFHGLQLSRGPAHRVTLTERARIAHLGWNVDDEQAQALIAALLDD